MKSSIILIAALSLAHPAFAQTGCPLQEQVTSQITVDSILDNAHDAALHGDRETACDKVEDAVDEQSRMLEAFQDCGNVGMVNIYESWIRNTKDYRHIYHC